MCCSPQHYCHSAHLAIRKKKIGKPRKKIRNLTELAVVVTPAVAVAVAVMTVAVAMAAVAAAVVGCR
jgi:hypothetical protein